MAVRLDIRPRLTLPAEPAAKVQRRWRLPPLALPAVAYWLGMAALTYAFAHLGQAGLAGAELPASGLPPADEPALAVPALADPEPPLTRAPEPPSPAESAAAPPREAEPAPAAEPEPASPAESEPEPAASLASRRAAPAPPALPAGLPGASRFDFPEFTDAPRALPPTDAAAPAVVTSCEAAIARNNEQLELGAPRGPADLSRGQYAAILERGSYLAACSIPPRTVVEICAAVKEGRALGITVTSNPPSAALGACVRGAVSRLKFPASPRMDVTRTRFDAAP